MPLSNCIPSSSKGDSEESRLKREQDRKLRENTRRIDKTLSDDRRRDLRCLKLLLLGTGESGKSTIIKQMKIININGFTEQEKLDYIPNIKKNVRDAIVAIIAGMEHLQIPFNNPENEQKRQYLFNESFRSNYDYPPEFFDFVNDLWKDGGVQDCYQRSNEYHLIDSAKYFLERLSVIRQPAYVPTNQDILRCRKMTDAISEITFEIQDRKKTKVNFKVFDVGGQQGERKKWIQLFDTVTAILFLADVSSYDLTLREQRHKNRLLDAIEVFQQTWLNKYLQTVPILVFINKIDILEDKIRVGRYLSSYLNSIVPSSTPELPSHQAALQGSGGATASQVAAFAALTSMSSSSRDATLTSMSSSSREKKEETEETGRSGRKSLSPNSNGVVHAGRASQRKSIFKILTTREPMSAEPEAPTPQPVTAATCDALTEFCNQRPFATFEPTSDERREFLYSFPLDAVGRTINSMKGGHSRSRDLPDVHPETIKTACYIKNLFAEITKQRVITYKTLARDRKSLFFYTCAVNTDNIHKVLEGCGAFLMEEHLEKFGIL